MAWPEVVFVGTYPNIVNRLAHLPDFAPHDVEILTYEPDDAPAVRPSSVVAVVVDRFDLRDRYEGVPTLCHLRLADKHRHLGKWSVTIDGLGMDATRTRSSPDRRTFPTITRHVSSACCSCLLGSITR